MLFSSSFLQPSQHQIQTRFPRFGVPWRNSDLSQDGSIGLWEPHFLGRQFAWKRFHGVFFRSAIC